MTNPETDRPAAVPPPMARAAKAEALLLRFTAEAHRRKWNYDRGLDGDGVPVKSEAFDALHRLGEEMRVALEELRRMPAAVSVPPPAPRADDQAAAIASCPGYEMNPNPCRCPCEGCKHHCAAHNPAAVSGPCVAGEQQNETPEAEAGCAHCGKTIRRITATLAEWWVHDPGGHTICVPGQAVSSPRATPKPAGVQDGAAS